jgi:hypothetical protein
MSTRVVIKVTGPTGEDVCTVEGSEDSWNGSFWFTAPVPIPAGSGFQIVHAPTTSVIQPGAVVRIPR